MSRPLGSRNKSTLERLEFERKVRNLMEKSNAEYIDKFRGVSRDYDKPNSGYVFSSESPVSSNPVRVKELNNKTSNNKASNNKTSSVHVLSEYSDTSDSLNPGYDNNQNNQNNQNVSNSIKEKETEDLKEKENTIESTTSNATQEQPKKRRGRPRKNPSPEISNVENVGTTESTEVTDTDTTKTENVDNSVDNVDNFTETENNPATETDNNPTVTVTEPSKRRSKTSSDNTPHCSRCDTIILCSPNRTDTNAVSGVSDCHRSCPRYVILCNHCSNELSEIIDNWLWNNGQGVVPKPWSDFGVKEMRMAEKKFENRKGEN